MAEQPKENTSQGGNGADRQFAIQKIFLKDVSLETPNSPDIFREQWKPDTNIQLGNSAKMLSDGVYEVATTITVTVKVGEKTAFLIEVQQAGIFTIGGFSDDERGAIVGSHCPTVLFPYAREAISDLVTKAGFPQLLLAPVNFEAIYAQHVQQLREQKNTENSEAAQPPSTH